jgi:hypothetical protein
MVFAERASISLRWEVEHHDGIESDVNRQQFGEVTQTADCVTPATPFRL